MHATESWSGPGGGGAVAAVQLTRLSDACRFFTALGRDTRGECSLRELEDQGLEMHVSWHPGPTRRAFTHVDDDGERTITVIGDRIGPRGKDDLPWSALESTDATYFTAGDIEALERARASRVLVATSRALNVLEDSAVRLDALVGSAADPAETYAPGTLDPPPALVVMTAGKEGGIYWDDQGSEHRFTAPELDHPVVDRYGAGDSFAAGLTWALGAGMDASNATAFAGRCGAAALSVRGPLGGRPTHDS